MGFKKALADNRLLFTKTLIFLTGFYMGLSLSSWIRGAYVYPSLRSCAFVGRADGPARVVWFRRQHKISEELATKQLLFAGIMTAEKFLNSRASAVHDTWGKNVPGKLIFFAGNETGQTHELPVVKLSGVDDSYPPQRKSFMMLKHMYENYIDDYEWFMRLDDDVYVRTEKLEKFLRTLNSSEDLFIGQAGTGAAAERGQLGLGPKDNFCMGGPGIVMSRSVLMKLAPHLEDCANNLVSTHEDVEVGRCVKKYVGVSCTWAFEMQWLFYHNQSKSNAFHGDLDTKAVHNAITLHPIKDPACMYRVHAHFLKEEILNLQHRSVRKSSVIHNLKESTRGTLAQQFSKISEAKDLYQNIPLNATLHWEMFNAKKLFALSFPPSQPVLYSLRRNLNLVLRRALTHINLESRKVILRELLLSKVDLGYVRLSPTKGIQYILDMEMLMYQHIGFGHRKLPVNVQYQSHIQQAFGNLIFTSALHSNSAQSVYVNIILPLAGRVKTFKKFLLNFERTVLMKNENVRLLVVYFPRHFASEEHKKILEGYAETYPNFEILWQIVEGDFSRSVALQWGTSQFSADSLLFFCDVDVQFDTEFFNRCRQNTVKGKRIYYPIVYSQFNQSISLPSRKLSNKKETVAKTRIKKENSYNRDQSRADDAVDGQGFWRRYGFGIVCVYGEDVKKVGGFDTNIQGWGLEDVKLFEQFLASGRYDVIRAPDPGLVHLYHVSNCTLSLPPNQLKACRDSALSQIASAGSLVNFMIEKDYI